MSSIWRTAELIMLESLAETHKQSPLEEVEEAEEQEP
jgi:hypothetical protein